MRGVAYGWVFGASVVVIPSTPVAMIRCRTRTNMTTSTELADTPFASLAALAVAFEDGLRRMLADDGLGAFILVLANAGSDAATFDRLRTALAQAYATWCERLDDGDLRITEAAADDVAVLRRLREYGFERLTHSRSRRVGSWELQFNPVRAFRPPRMSAETVRELYATFDPHGFHFDQPYLRPEILWEGRLLSSPLRVLFNKFPFAERHTLVVPDPVAHRPQYLDADVLDLVWRMAERLRPGLPGIGFGYNAQGAYASVNHLHFQCFVRTDGDYPVEASYWRHNGGDRPYPLTVQVFDQLERLVQSVTRLQASNQAFNLLIRRGRGYLIQRACQGQYRHSEWTGGFAWSEVVGAVTVFDQDAFERLREQDLDAEFQRLAVRP